MSETWSTYPECGCQPGGEHFRTCSWWHRNRYHGASWKPRRPHPESEGDEISHHVGIPREGMPS